MANLGNDIVADLLGKLKDRSLKVRAQEEGQEGLILAIRKHLEKGEEMGVGAGKGGPVAAGVRSSGLEADTLASGQVEECARGVG